MNKMFRIGVLSVAMCLGVSAGSLKADFEADLLSVLNFVFGREAVEDPLWWIGEEGCDADAYCCKLGELYRDFFFFVRNIVQNNRALRLSKTELEEDPDVFAERAFCLLKLSRDLYATVSEYASATYNFDEDNGFKNVEPLLLSECRYVFVRRILGLSRFVIRHHAEKLDLGMFVDTKDRKPDEKILAEILKPFAKKDARKELEAKGDNSQLIQSLRVLSNVFDKFSRNNGEMSNKIKEAFGEPLFSWFGVPTSGNETDYREYVLEYSAQLSVALRDLSRNVWSRVERMLSVKGKLSAEQKKEALPFLRKEKDIGVLLKDAETFRNKEKEKRKNKQEAFAKAKAEQEGLRSKMIEKTKALKEKKDALSNLQGSGTEISDRKKELENEIQKMNEAIETLKVQIKKLPYLSVKAKYKMQRKAAKEGIEKKEHDMAIFANYVQLPDKCGAFQNAFLYYQTLIWNVFTDGINVTRGYGRKIYDVLKVKELELTDDFEEEYKDFVKGI